MTDGTIDTLRRMLFFTLALGAVGLEGELLLLGHFDDWKQYLPLVLLALVLAAQGWVVMTRTPASIRGVRAAMWLCIVSGTLGVYLHYRGNAEFELEMTPGIGGWALFRESMTGATPALAPGAMVQLGLVGLAWAFRHPALRRTPNDS
jgi:hypothetical protein